MAFRLHLIGFRAKPGQMAVLRDCYNSQVLPQIRSTPGHHSSHFNDGITDPNEGLGWIAWDGPEQARDYIQSGAFAHHVAIIREYLDGEPVLHTYLPV